jgi:hypothetical protein
MKAAIAVLTSVLLVIGVATISAHDQFRIIGTLTKAQPTSLEVRTKEGKTVFVELNRETLISRDRKKAEFGDLKTGGSVVIDALGDTYDDLVALEVRIVPPIAAPTN